MYVMQHLFPLSISFTMVGAENELSITAGTPEATRVETAAHVARTRRVVADCTNYEVTVEDLFHRIRAIMQAKCVVLFTFSARESSSLGQSHRLCVHVKDWWSFLRATK